MRTSDRDQIRGVVPPFARIAWPRNPSGAPELRLGTYYAPDVRYIYGYVGFIERLRGTCSTSGRFLCHVATKLTWKDDGVGKFRLSRSLPFFHNAFPPWFPDVNNKRPIQHHKRPSPPMGPPLFKDNLFARLYISPFWAFCTLHVCSGDRQISRVGPGAGTSCCDPGLGPTVRVIREYYLAQWRRSSVLALCRRAGMTPFLIPPLTPFSFAYSISF